MKTPYGNRGAEATEGRTVSAQTAPCAAQGAAPAAPAGEPDYLACAKDSVDIAIEYMRLAAEYAHEGNVDGALYALAEVRAWLRYAQAYLEYEIEKIMRFAGESE
jgi:hypothetical protein